MPFPPLQAARAAAVFVALLSGAAVTARAQTGSPPLLPVRAVTLFSSGVSYTLREGEVSGDVTVPLTFRTGQINDILKSLVLLDEKGTVQPAVYGARDPIGRTLQSFAVDVSQPIARADLLNRLRGERVVVEAGGTVIAAATTTPKETLTGQIVGVEQKAVAQGFQQVTIEILTVLGEKGLQSVRLDEVRSIRLLDERLNREFREALTLLSTRADDARRQVALRFDGDGKRRVRVGYVTEAPLWKISYRLLLGSKEEAGAAAAAGTARPYLQGWALVENTSDEDWTDVRLSLVSGRPVSFIQDLYQPLYLPRPVVPPDVIASPFPQLAEGNLDEDRSRQAAKNAPAGGLGGGPGAPAPSAAPRPRRNAGREEAEAASADAAAESLYFNQVLGRASVAAQAAGEKAGELFQYRIKMPVTLPRQQAAMIPVIAQEIDGGKLSLYNADTGPRFPMNAVRVKNDTTLHLKGGPVTVFDDGVYAGDARMEDVPPGDSRLVTYAVDLSVEGERQGTGSTATETTLALRRGVLSLTRRERQETTYTLKNKADKPRTVLVEHPFRPEYRLIEPKEPAERTSDRYRFEVVVPPGASQKLVVVAERPISQTLGLMDADLNALAVHVNRKEVSERLQAALRDVIQRRRRVQELQDEAAQAEAEIAAIDRDQERIRKNMTALDKESALYKRYVAQLDQQETRLQALRDNAARLRAAAAEADRALRAHLDTLDIAS